jgi:hypothetical protein
VGCLTEEFHYHRPDRWWLLVRLLYQTHMAAEEVLSQDYQAWGMICGWGRLRKWQ